MNLWWIVLLVGLLLVIGLAWILVQTPWMKAVHDDYGTAFTLGCPMGLGFNYDDQIVPLDQQIVVPATIKQTRTRFNPAPQKIPRIIYQTHERSLIPIEMREAIQGILEMNPDYNYRYFDNRAGRAFLSKHFEPRVLNCYNKLIPGAYKADLFRYCILYVKGGVYLDTGFLALVPLSEILRPTDTFISSRDGSSDGLYNAFIACTPNHPIIKATLDLVLDRIEREEYGPNCLYPTGPLALRDGFKQSFGYDLTIEEKDYGQGIRLFQHQTNSRCNSNQIMIKGLPIFYTKYPNYRSNMKWYSQMPNYTPLYNKRLIYASNYQPDLPAGHRFQENCPGFIGSPQESKMNVPMEDRLCSSVVKHCSASNRPCQEQQIPRRIYQTHERDEVPIGMKAVMQTILEKNPHYEYFYYNAKDRRAFIKQHFDRRTVKCYDRLVPGAYQADLFRYCIIYVYGGVYLDAGFVAAESLDSVIRPNDTFVAAKDIPPGALLTGFICSTAHHPVIRETLDLVLDRIEYQDYGSDPLYPTGPIAFGEGFKRATGKVVDHLGRYTPEIQLLDCQVVSGCAIGVINHGTRLIFQTKYPNYRLDATWYNPQPYYAKLWQDRTAFKSTVDESHS